MSGRIKGSSINLRTLLIVVGMGLCWADVYALAFIQFILYIPFQESIGISNTQMGFLLTLYGFGNVFGAPFGGWISDRFNPKKIYILSLILTGLFSIVYAFHMTYNTAIIIWILLAVSSLFMNFPAHIKLVRLLASERDQGKIFGFNESAIGLTTLAFNALQVWVYSLIGEPYRGMQMVAITIGVVTLICAVMCYFIIPNFSEEELEGVQNENETSKLTIKDFFVVIKSPATWILATGIFCVYSFQVTTTYFTPYFSAVLGLAVTSAGFITLLRDQVMRLLGAPFGGMIADRIQSPIKVLLLVYFVGLTSILCFRVIPAGTPTLLIVLMTLFIAFFVYMGRGVYYAVATELKVPRKYAATTVGVGAAMGFLPDIFQFLLFGHWLDSYGNAGYDRMFIFQAVVLAVGIIIASLSIKFKSKITHQGERLKS